MKNAGVLLGLLLLTTACQSTTLLQVNFNANAIGSPPSAAQEVGTLSVQPGEGSVTVVGAPAAGLTEHKWARITHPTMTTPETVMRADLAQVKGDGSYTFLTAMFIPGTTSGLATIQFEAPGGAEFLHLDFMPAGHVRINDGATTFGSFPKDTIFLVTTHFNIAASGATAEVHLTTGGASGMHTVNIPAAQLNAARQWAAVRFWMGFQWTGSFFVDDILVKWDPPS